ncbi:RND family efflux transporter MFP subunit [Flammeovirgaceae bacterium 311]|nr:RND family efflux transporter MFP subunit [Flammeovirgaceae bacterium 311]
MKSNNLNMKHNLTWLVAAIICSVALSSCGNNGDGAQQGPLAAAAVPVSTYTVQAEAVTGTDTYPGTVVPLNEVELRPQVAGYITNIYVQDGQTVKQGQRIYEIDQSKYQAAQQQAQANLQSARANLEKVQKDLERYERLAEQDAIATQRVDYARTDLATAQAQVATAQAQVRSVSTDLGYSVITAPFDGVIGISQVRIGTQVSPGQPLLNTISSVDPMAVDFVINEQEIPRFNRYLQNPKEQPDSLFTIVLSGGIPYALPGRMSAIDRAVGRQTGTIAVRVQFSNPDQQLIPGMTVSVKVLNQDIGRQLVIPYKAVSEQLGEYYVYKIQGDSVVQQNVALGTRFGRNIVVREGLQSGDDIVVEGIQRLRQGAKIQTGQPQSASR